jgi:diguanylate cyclase (GGDEF)-like protein
MRPAALALAALAALAAALAAGPALGDEPAAPPEADLAAARGRERLEVLTRLTVHWAEKDPARATTFGIEALALAVEAGDARREASLQFALGDAARVAGRHDGALERYEAARRLHAAAGDAYELARSERRLGDVYYFISEYDRALELYLAALARFEALAASGAGKVTLVHVAHLNATIGNVEQATGDLPAAREHYRRALAIYEEHEVPGGVAGATYNLGMIAQELKDDDTALAHYARARETATALGDRYLESLALSATGSVSLERGRPDDALPYFREALALCRTLDRKRGILTNLLRIAEAERARGRFRDALAVLDEAGPLAVTLSDTRLEADIHKERAADLERVGDPAGALASLRRYAALHDEVLGAEKTKRLAELRIAHETTRKEQAIALLRAEKSIERQLRWTALGALGFAVVVLALVLSRTRLRGRTDAEIRRKNDELERAYARVDELSRTDELTGLPNRRALTSILEQEASRAHRSGQPLSLVLADVDDLKRCNDEHGHACGDSVLTAVGRMLRRALREHDVVGRWGGDEFLFVLPETDLEGALNVAERARVEVADTPFEWHGAALPITLSLGVATTAGSHAEAALQRADEALLDAKRAGKNRVGGVS